MQIETKSVDFDLHKNFFSMLLLTKLAPFARFQANFRFIVTPKQDCYFNIFVVPCARRLLRHKLEKVLDLISLKFPLISKTYTH